MAVLGATLLDEEDEEITGLTSPDADEGPASPPAASTTAVDDGVVEEIDLGLTEEDLALDDVMPPAEVTESPGPELDDLVDADEPIVAAEAVAPAPAPRMATPLETMRVPAIPEANLTVAAAMESVARRLRAGELMVPGVQAPLSDEAALALALAAILGIRH